ncbi:MAG: DUF1761 domain-containing protein [Parachlamydia sp.]|jgi:hypothetical protein|nr:DUF1761 domain-containing protein [Parachlamydia sp.]
MFLENVPINYLAVILAAASYYILGAFWYSPALFGSRGLKHEWGQEDESKETPKWAAYAGELVIAFIIAYILALFVRISGAKQILDGIVVSLWVWVGFIATTHFSAVLWARKTLKSFFVHAGFMLFGLLIMGATIALFG